jgi:NADH-quinone oxidoreductase subunit L
LRLSPSGCWSSPALFTSFYSWRLIFMTFHGKPRASADVMSHVHESPAGDAGAALCAGGRARCWPGIVFKSSFAIEHHEGWTNSGEALLPGRTTHPG